MIGQRSGLNVFSLDSSSLLHPFAQGIAYQEISLRIAIPMMAGAEYIPLQL